MKTFSLNAVGVALAVLALTAVKVSAQAARTAPTGGVDVAAGEKLFQRNCVLCHGGDGTGGRGPDLTRGVFRRASTDEQLYGILNGDLWEVGMGGVGLNDTEIWQVMAYLRSLGGSRKAVPGDPERGRDIFFGSATCGTCHMANGHGARQGPDLSWIGWRRSADYLRAAIEDPNAEVDPRWWRGVAITERGDQIVGYLIAEDQFNVRLHDADDRLHALPKVSLRSFERVKVSSMPKIDLSEDDITDVVAFLSRLTGTGNDR